MKIYPWGDHLFGGVGQSLALELLSFVNEVGLRISGRKYFPYGKTLGPVPVEADGIHPEPPIRKGAGLRIRSVPDESLASYPFTTPSGRRRATFLEIPAPWTTSTTWATSL